LVYIKKEYVLRIDSYNEAAQTDTNPSFILTTTCMEAIEKAEDPIEPQSQTLTIIGKSPRGKAFRKPIALTASQAKRLEGIGRSLANYILDSCSLYLPSLVSFILEYESVLAVAKYLFRYKSKSALSLTNYCYCIRRFSTWLGKAPDELVAEARDPNHLSMLPKILEDYLGCLEDEGLSPSYIKDNLSAIKTFYMVNGSKVGLPYRLPDRIIYRDRAPTPEELCKLLEVGDLRERFIVACLALGGFREGTLAALRYCHVRTDIEKDITPVHIHVEAEITKGKYHDYNTFLGAEAAEYLRLYLEQRRRGSPCGKVPPEELQDESPLIRHSRHRKPEPIGAKQIYEVVHNLYIKAGLLKQKKGRRYDLRVHSIRKFFRTQLAALGVPGDYIEYMMGHTISTYHDIEMKGVDFLRNVYAASGLSIKPKTKLTQYELMATFVRGLGLDPEKVLIREAFAKPHRTLCTPDEREKQYVQALREAIIDMLRKELLNSGERT